MNRCIYMFFGIGIFFLLTACSGSGITDDNNDLPCPIPREWTEDPEWETVNLTIQNYSCTAICSVYLSPRSCDDWGVDWLGDKNLYSGGQVVLHLKPGWYDIMFESCTGQPLVGEKIDLREDNVSTLENRDVVGPIGCPVSLTVINNSPQPICSLWITNQTEERFDLNWLGEDQLESGDSISLVLPEDTYDLKAEGCDSSLLGLELDLKINSHQTWTVP